MRKPMITGSQNPTETKHRIDFNKTEALANMQTYLVQDACILALKTLTTEKYIFSVFTAFLPNHTIKAHSNHIRKR
jgi:hypothetical protein